MVEQVLRVTHAGFSAPDNAINYDPNLGVDPRLDFAAHQMKAGVSRMINGQRPTRRRGGRGGLRL